MQRLLNDLLNLIYPGLCVLCYRPLAESEQHICLHCINKLPRTKYWNDKENKASEMFWGKINVEWVIPFLHFMRKGKVRQLIHEIKYHNNKALGIYLGYLFGMELVNHSVSEADLIIPVPISHQKLSARGYNQAFLIAEGLSKALNIPINDKILIRVNQIESQTRKGRYDRWLNVQENFKVINYSFNLNNKHILLVDDVLTTGATLETCATELIKVAACKISFLTLAVAELV